MSVIVNFNNTSYTIPQFNETGWASEVTSWIQAVSASALSKAGGTFTLTADVDFGASFGLRVAYVRSRSANPASAGVFRLANTETVAWRNVANAGNNVLSTDGSDNLTYNGVPINTSSAVIDVAHGGTGITSYTIGDTIYASGATTLSKLGIGTVNFVLSSTGTAPQWGLIVNANIDAAAAIAYSKLALTGAIVNADVSASAAIARSKIAAGTADHVVINAPSTGVLSSEAQLAVSRGGTNLASYTTGDVIYASAGTTLSKLAIGSTGQVMKVAGGIPSWGSAQTSLATTAKTTTYTILNTDDAITADSSGGAFTMTLPDCATNAGKVFYIKKISTDFSAVTIQRAGSDTLFGVSSTTSTTLNTVGEEIVLVSFGSTVWQILERRVPSVWTAYTAAFTGVGSVTNIDTWWRRVGDSIEIRGSWTNGNPTSVEAQMTMPTGLTSDATKNPNLACVTGVVAQGVSATTYFGTYALVERSVAYLTFARQTSTADNTSKQLGSNAFTNGALSRLQTSTIPISGWNG